MSTELVQTGVKFPDATIQTTAASSSLVYAVKLMNTDDQTTAYRHAFAIMNDGSVKGWGANGNGQLGVGYTTVIPQAQDVAFPPDFPGAFEVHTSNEIAQYCIDKTGQLWAWGRNAYGEIGVGSTAVVRIPVNVSKIASNSIYGKTIVQVAVPCGIEDVGFVLVRCSDGTVHACGYNGYGQCGNGNTTQQNYFVRCGTITATWIACGRENYTACSAVVGGVLYNWGYNGDAQLGNGNTTSNVYTPTARTAGSLAGKTIVKSFASRFCQFALASDGTFHGAGNQNDGSFGIGTTSVYYAWTQINTNVKDAQCAHYEYSQVTIQKNDNTVWLSGHPAYVSPNTVANPDGYGGYYYTQQDTHIWKQMTLPTVINGVSVTPQKVVHGGTGSYNFIAVLMTNGWIYTCGYNGNGMLGLGDYVARTYDAPGVVLCPLAQDIGTYGHGSEGCLLILTRNNKVMVSGYGGEYCNGTYNANTNNVPLQINFN